MSKKKRYRRKTEVIAKIDFIVEIGRIKARKKSLEARWEDSKVDRVRWQSKKEFRKRDSSVAC